MDSGPGAYAPSRNDDPPDVSGFMESIVSYRRVSGWPSVAGPLSRRGPYLFSVNWISG
jgi:hypothetical protein